MASTTCSRSFIHSASLLFFFFLFFFIITLQVQHASANNNTLTAYQILQHYNFPVGLLPEGVTSYELNEQTGEFKAYLNETCSFPLESYTLKYKPIISGVISQNRVRKLKGISVKVLLLWLNISEVIRDGDELEFSVGIAYADFPVENFVECPKCGCGMDCVSGEKIENLLVASS